MNRSAMFALALAVAVVCLIVGILYFVGGYPLHHHTKRGILAIGLAVVAVAYAMMNRPQARRR